MAADCSRASLISHTSNSWVTSNLSRRVNGMLTDRLEDRVIDIRTSRSPDLVGLGHGLTKLESPDQPRTAFRISMRKEIPVARVAESILTEAIEIEALARAIAELVACGNNRLVIDFSNVTRVSRNLLALLVRTHRRFHELGGRLKLCGLSPQLSQFVFVSRLEHVLAVAPDEETAVTSEWNAAPPRKPLPAASPLKVPSQSRTNKDSVATFDEMIFGWLTRKDRAEVSRVSNVEECQDDPGMEQDFNDSPLRHRVHLDVLILEPRPPRLDGEPAVRFLLRALTAIREAPQPGRAVIDMSQTASHDSFENLLPCRLIAIREEGLEPVKFW